MEKGVKSINFQKSSETISHIPNCIMMRSREQNKFIQWRTKRFLINYNGGTVKDTKKARPFVTMKIIFEIHGSVIPNFENSFPVP